LKPVRQEDMPRSALILIFLFGGTMIQAGVGVDRSLVIASRVVTTLG